MLAYLANYSSLSIHSILSLSLSLSLSVCINCRKPWWTFWACPMSLEVLGLRAADVSGCSKCNEVKLHQRLLLSWNHIFVSALSPYTLIELIGFNPISFVSLNLFITPTIDMMPEHMVFRLCVLAFVVQTNERSPVRLRSSTCALRSILGPRFKPKHFSLGIKGRNHTYSMALS